MDLVLLGEEEDGGEKNTEIVLGLLSFFRIVGSAQYFLQ